jgi:hypothetical protein
MIKRRSRAEIVDFSSEEFKEDEKISYCSHCLEYGFKVVLTNRIYPDNEPVPPDKDQWKMCLDCGNIYALFQLEQEAIVTDAVEVTDNPHDVGRNEFLGIDRRILAKKRKKDRDKELDYVHDENLKAELRKGHTLLSYSEQIPQ